MAAPDSVEQVFWGETQLLSRVLMRFAHGKIRDQIVSHKNDHGASYERYGVSKWGSRLKVFLRFWRRSVFDFGVPAALGSPAISIWPPSDAAGAALKNYANKSERVVG